MAQLAVVILAFIGNFVIQWYGNFAGKLPAKGTYLGVSYDSVLVRSIVTQFEYLWILVIINVVFTYMFHLGFASFKNFISFALIWLAMGPISALIFNTFVLKEKTGVFTWVGVFFIITGSIFVVAQKEIMALLKG